MGLGDTELGQGDSRADKRREVLGRRQAIVTVLEKKAV